MIKTLLVCSVAILLSVSSKSFAQGPPQSPAAAEFNKLVNEYFDAFFKFNPSQGTAAGFHQYDSQLEDPSQAGRAAEIASIKEFEPRFDGVKAEELSPQAASDLELVKSDMNGRLLKLQEIRSGRKTRTSIRAG
jgi:uncharacterized protein (DUF885 family)